MKLPTASSLERAMACPMSVLLPTTDAPNPAADEGTAVHLFLQLLTNGNEPGETQMPLTGQNWPPVCHRIEIEWYDAN